LKADEEKDREFTIDDGTIEALPLPFGEVDGPPSTSSQFTAFGFVKRRKNGEGRRSSPPRTPRTP